MEKIQKNTAAYKEVIQEFEKMYQEAEWIRNIPLFKDLVSSPLADQIRYLDKLKSELEVKK
ncbi:hypothetical protein HPY28_27025 [Brevibacillus sp. HB1.2]|uniref:hypothetical protein n=1 Tax=Brevibacillus TaxID=55080 RepID=UPI0003824755|nr:MULTISPECIES: hypothetical protein [unclassified Brevibacillus]ATF16355.1 hypothetical protein A616_31685 [Brevibacillus brevis X23]NRS18739.1 hypothetical protein [Brevibacillus sp. HB1.4B]NTU23980.1 hypothetical protein [Brevibacillus sp. HB1.2]NTU33802.1 hypothetical protein [Brevibacillus sp. HB1.1]